MSNYKEIETLTRKEKIELAELLWDSIERDMAMPMTKEQQNILNERLIYHEKHPNEGKSWEEVMKKYI